MVFTWLDFGVVLLKTVILANFLDNFRMCFFKVTILAISQEWLVRLMWNKKEVHRYDTGYNLWPWPLTSLMTLTLEIAVAQELLVWLMWNEKEVSWYDTGLPVWHCPLTTPMTLTLEFQGQSLKLLYLRNGVADWHGTKRMSHPFMTMILTSVTMVGWADVPDSDVGVPSTYQFNFSARCQRDLHWPPRTRNPHTLDHKRCFVTRFTTDRCGKFNHKQFNHCLRSVIYLKEHGSSLFS